MVYTTRFAGGRGGRNGLEHELRRLDIVQKNSRPNHPTTCGKVERFQQTLKKWLRAQPDQPTTIAELQALLDRLRRRVQPPPTAPLPAPPRHPGHRLHRPTQGHPRHRPRRRHPRPGPPRQGRQGRQRHPARRRPALRHIGIGRTHAGTHVILLVQDLDIRIINAATGELLRELTIDPNATTSPPADHPDHHPQSTSGRTHDS